MQKPDRLDYVINNPFKKCQLELFLHIPPSMCEGVGFLPYNGHLPLKVEVLLPTPDNRKSQRQGQLKSVLSSRSRATSPEGKECKNAITLNAK